MHYQPSFRFLFVFFGFLLFWGKSVAQTPSVNTTTVDLLVLDAGTDQPLPYFTCRVPGRETGAKGNEQGRVEFQCPPATDRVVVSLVGYRDKEVRLQPGRRNKLTVRLEASDNLLEEVTVKPGKYRNKNNPAVELIENVVRFRDSNRVEAYPFFQFKQYEKVLFGLSETEKVRSARLLKPFRFVLDNVDSSRMEGAGVSPVYIQENISDVYLRHKPAQRREYVVASRSVELEGLFDEQGLFKGTRRLYQHIDLYNNTVMLFNYQFLSPIAGNGPLFYRYYLGDTLGTDAERVVKLSFFPKNKTDLLLQGDLYITLDGRYAVQRVEFTVNPDINLNWVSDFAVEQQFTRNKDNKWVVSFEDLRMRLGITSKGMGIFGERTLKYDQFEVPETLPDSLFAGNDEIIYRPEAKRRPDSFWNAERPLPISLSEKQTYAALDSLRTLKTFARTVNVLKLLLAGYREFGPWELGPVNTFYSFNDVEGFRLRVGGRTTFQFSKKLNFEGYFAYGFKDKQPKFYLAGTYAFSGNDYKNFPIDIVRLLYQDDTRIPGQDLQFIQQSSIALSFVRGNSDKLFYTRRFAVHREREWANHFSIAGGFEQSRTRPGGLLRFETAEASTHPQVTTSKFYVNLRYAPNEQIYQSKSYRRPIAFNYIANLQYSAGVKGLLGGEYKFHQVSASIYKYTPVSVLGYNYLFIEGGAVLGKSLPYSLLTFHRANQSYIYQIFSYNLMNFMEFISDRYIAVNMEHNFNGFFLNKIPLLKQLKWREVATAKILYGGLTAANDPDRQSGLFAFPTEADGRPLTYTLEARPYMEVSVGIANIFKVLRLDLVRRINYLDHPGAVKYGLRAKVGLKF